MDSLFRTYLHSRYCYVGLHSPDRVRSTELAIGDCLDFASSV